MDEEIKMDSMLKEEVLSCLKKARNIIFESRLNIRDKQDFSNLERLYIVLSNLERNISKEEGNGYITIRMGGVVIENEEVLKALHLKK